MHTASPAAVWFGPRVEKDSVCFRLWAPKQSNASVTVDGLTFELTAVGDGWFECALQGNFIGSRYHFNLADGLVVPDPASRYQPEDVHGPSEVVQSPVLHQRSPAWKGRPWEEVILYELHVGTFTPEGTFAAIIEKLDYLAALGITAIELMPIADFPGQRNWGYDGVLLYAPDAAYGRPEDLKALIDAAHARNMMVFLDAVYNHFGPDGNYLPTYSNIFNEQHHTPWGAAVNYDGAGAANVRELIIQNAIYWIVDFGFDGLRLDAVHAIRDDSRSHVLNELALRVRAAAPGRHVHLIVENEENDADLLGGSLDAGFTAQWNDDVHHTLHCAATGERAGYYGDYAGNTAMLARSLAEGFSFQGEMMPYRGSARGKASRHLPPVSFVSFIQNHDQVGNRAFGDRLITLVPEERLKALVSIYLLLPQIPMLFMGEEFGCTRPFPFFCDFAPPLADLVKNGRREEFAKFPEFADPNLRANIPDPTAEETFLSAKIDWSQAEIGEGGGRWLTFYRDLISLRRAEIIPRLAGIGGDGAHYEVLRADAFRINWRMGDGSHLELCANLSDQPILIEPARAARIIWSLGSFAEGLAGWGVVWSIRLAEAEAPQ